MNKESCMIHSTRFHPTTQSELVEANGLIDIYNRGQSDMYDYLMDRLNKLYISHIVADFERPNSYVLMDFFNQFKEFIKEDDGHILEELDKIMEDE